jgi:caffeoyl-CoA O-methyltransferase/O-methyltransferase
VEGELKKVGYADRVFPTQEFGSHLFKGAGSFDARIFDLLAQYTKPYDLPESSIEHPDHIGLEEMTTPPSQVALFHMLIRLAGAKRVLEIGTFVGKTTMILANILGPDGHVTAIEAAHSFAEMARRNFVRNGVADRITLLEGDAGKVLDDLKGQSFDLIFVDGAKQSYLPFTLKSIDLLSERGIIVVDDVFFHGDVVNDPPTTDKGAGCRDVLEYFSRYDRCEKLIIPSWNGTLLLYGFAKA